MFTVDVKQQHNNNSMHNIVLMKPSFILVSSSIAVLMIGPQLVTKPKNVHYVLLFTYFVESFALILEQNLDFKTLPSLW